tara:strand:+ start:78 stop:761 length:684 start_codon:yes stop_codon:yes gene_type:complete
MNSNYKILVVDDDPDIIEILKYNLLSEGYNVRSAPNGLQALAIAKEFIPDLIILDIMIPKMDGVETCRQIRTIPELANKLVIFLTARLEEYSEIAAFEIGADDYITKPIKPRALISRINALFRRNSKKNSENFKITSRNLEINPSSYIVKINGKKISLPKKEFEILFFLARNPDQVFNREALLENIWGSGVYVLARTIDVHVRKIREKIGDGFINTVKGVGYKFSGD